jgi:hypothetical protein
MKNGRKRERVQCSGCGFSWQAPTSVAAVKAYWRERVVATRVKAKVSKRRIPGRTALQVVPGITPAVHVEAATTALVASAGGN